MDDITPDERLEALGFASAASDYAIGAAGSANLNVALALTALRKLCRSTVVGHGATAATASGSAGATTTRGASPPASVSLAPRPVDPTTPQPSGRGSPAMSVGGNLPHTSPPAPPAASTGSQLAMPVVDRRVNRETQRLARNVGAHAQVRRGWVNTGRVRLYFAMTANVAACVELNLVWMWMWGWGWGSQVIALLKFLQSQKDPQLMTLYQLAHTFLQDFCSSNPQNQELLHNDVDFLMVRPRWTTSLGRGWGARAGEGVGEGEGRRGAQRHSL